MEKERLRHPSLETLAALAEGRLVESERSRTTAHISGCDDCYTLFAETARFLEDTHDEMAEPTDAERKRTRWMTMAAAAAILFVTFGVFALKRLDRDPARMLVQNANALPNRLTEGRLAEDFAYRPPPVFMRGAREQKHDPVWLRLQGAAGEVLEQNRQTRTTAYAHVAIGDLQRAERILADLARRGVDAGRSWNDLAVVRVQIARSLDDPSYLPEALAAVDEAIRHDATFAPAHFNRALILEKLGLLSEARMQWQKYLSIDTTGAWADEARRRLQPLETKRASWKEVSSAIDDAIRRNLPQIALSSNDLAPIVSLEDETLRLSRRARATSEVIDLAAWGRAEIEGRDDDATRALARARFIANVLVTGRDEWLLHDAIAVIDTSAGIGRNRLAEAHVLYDDGRRALAKNPSSAIPLLEKATLLFAESGSPMELVAMNFLAVAHHDHQSLGKSLEVAREAAARVRADRHRALAGQLAWQKGLTLFYQGWYDPATAEMHRAQQIFARLEETDSEAAAQMILADLAEYQGDGQNAWRHRIEGLRKASLADATYRQLAGYASAVRALVIEERPGAANALASIAIGAAERSREDLFIAYLHAQRAVARRQMGRDERQIESDLDRARLAANGLSDPALRNRTIAEVTVGRVLASNDQRSLEELDRALQFFETSSMEFAIPRLSLERARRLRSLGKHSEGFEEAERGLRLLANQRERVAGTNEAAEMFSVSSDDLRDELFLAARSANRLDSAFEIVSSLRRITPQTRSEAFTIEYQTTRDGVVIRTSTGALGFRPIDRDELREQRDFFLQMLAKDDEHSIRRYAQSFGRLLLGGLESQITASKNVSIIADEELSPIPFAILHLSEGRMLLEAAVVTMTRGGARNDPPASDSMLVVADPSFPRGTFPELASLDGAMREGGIIASKRRARILAKAEATRENVLRTIGTADIIHIAAHIVHNSRRPSSSAILLAGRDTESQLEASAIARMKLRRRPIVVLSSCEGSGAAVRHHDGIPNVAAAFLEAGASEVVAAAWKVDDHKVISLMEQFHETLATSRSAAAALRNAQLDAMKKGVPASAWAAYSTVRS